MTMSLIDTIKIFIQNLRDKVTNTSLTDDHHLLINPFKRGQMNLKSNFHQTNSIDAALFETSSGKMVAK